MHRVSATDPVVGTIECYDRIASEYAEIWFDDPVMKPLLDDFTSRLGPTGEVLDAGCGPGRDLAALDDRGYQSVGVDLSARMVEEARRRVCGSIVRRMDFRHLLFPQGTFDGVWCCACLQHLPLSDAEQSLREFARVLKDDGVLAIACAAGSGTSIDSLDRFQRLQTKDEFAQLLARCGFELVSVDIFDAVRTTDRQSPPRQWIQAIAYPSQARASDETSTHDHCVFCPGERFTVNRKLGLPGAGSILWGDDDLFWMIDAAPIRPGHSLLVSQEHSTCFGGTRPEVIKRAIDLQGVLRELVLTCYGSEPLFFEHGACRPGEAGSCIAHAHLHCVPNTSRSGLSRLDSLLGPPVAAALADLPKLHKGGNAYLYVEEQLGLGRCYMADVVPSQIIRGLLNEGDSEGRLWQSRCRQAESHVAFMSSVRLLSDSVSDSILSEGGAQRWKIDQIHS